MCPGCFVTWIHASTDITGHMMVGGSGVLCNLDSSNESTGHDDGYFGLNIGHIL